jgi:hypothetical protein
MCIYVCVCLSVTVLTVVSSGLDSFPVLTAHLPASKSAIPLPQVGESCWPFSTVLLFYQC